MVIGCVGTSALAAGVVRISPHEEPSALNSAQRRERGNLDVALSMLWPGRSIGMPSWASDTPASHRPVRERLNSPRGSAGGDNIRGRVPTQSGVACANEPVAVLEAPRAFSAAPLPITSTGLKARSLENLVALAKVLGVVRFYYPSERVMRTDWREFTAEAVARVEGLRPTEGLIDCLERIFADVAPSVVYRERLVSLDSNANDASARRAVMFWEHDAVVPNLSLFGGTDKGFASRLRLVALNDKRLPAGVARPDALVAIKVSSRDSVFIPVARWVDSTWNLADSARSAPQAFASRIWRYSDRVRRISGVIEAWNTIGQINPYSVGTTSRWESALKTALLSAASDESSEQYGATLKRLIAATRDGHGRVFGPDQRSAVLPFTTTIVGQHLVVTSVQQDVDVPRPGDVIMRIDGEPVEAVIKHWRGLVASATPQWSDVRVSEELSKRLPLDTVDLLLSRAGVGSIRASVVGRVPSSMADLPKQARPPAIDVLEPGIQYIDLTRVSDRQLAQEASAMMSAAAIIFDVRGRPTITAPLLLGHLTSTPVMSDHFLLPTFRQPWQREATFIDRSWRVASLAPKLNAKVYFLADANAMSYSESLLGVVAANRLGEIVGEPSAGTNGDITWMTLSDGVRLTWTGVLVLKRDGSPHHGVGVAPTIPVARDLAAYRANRDRILEVALFRAKIERASVSR